MNIQYLYKNCSIKDTRYIRSGYIILSYALLMFILYSITSNKFYLNRVKYTNEKFRNYNNKHSNRLFKTCSHLNGLADSKMIALVRSIDLGDLSKLMITYNNPWSITEEIAQRKYFH